MRSKDVSLLFDRSMYASTMSQKLSRSASLFLRYYLWDVPRYWRQLWSTGHRGLDLPVLSNPIREFARRDYSRLALPKGYDRALEMCGQAGVRFTMPEVRLAGVASVWWLTRGVSGDLIECGAYRGATSVLLAVLMKLNGIDKKIFALDTFSGMPAASKFDSARARGEFAPPADHLDVLRKQARELDIEDQLVVCPGLFAHTFAKLESLSLSYSFIHIDANLYGSTREACRYCLPRLVKGGAIVFDDYNGLCDLGARLAIRESIGEHGLRLRDLAHCSSWAQAGRV